MNPANPRKNWQNKIEQLKLRFDFLLKNIGAIKEITLKGLKMYISA